MDKKVTQKGLKVLPFTALMLIYEQVLGSI